MNPTIGRPPVAPRDRVEDASRQFDATTNAVVAVICTYEPGPDLGRRVDALLDQVQQVVVVDDGSGPEADAVLDTISGARVSVFRLGRNRGIAAALNAGIGLARDAGAQYLLTMDQDSLLGPRYVERAIAALQHLEHAGEGVLAIGAGTVNGVSIDPLDPRPFVPILDTLQSGLLFRLKAMAAIGSFDERLFIDCVDTEYILRGAGRGLATFRAEECALDHALGRSIEARLPFGRSVRFAHHSAWRRYYITRNRIQIVRDYGVRFPKWTALQAYDQVRYFGLTLLFGPRPRQQLMAFGIGAVHGLTRRLGPIPPDLMRRLTRAGGSEERAA